MSRTLIHTQHTHTHTLCSKITPPFRMDIRSRNSEARKLWHSHTFRWQLLYLSWFPMVYFVSIARANTHYAKVHGGHIWPRHYHLRVRVRSILQLYWHTLTSLLRSFCFRCWLAVATLAVSNWIGWKLSGNWIESGQLAWSYTRLKGNSAVLLASLSAPLPRQR